MAPELQVPRLHANILKPEVPQAAHVGIWWGDSMSYHAQVPRLHTIIVEPEVHQAALQQVTAEQIGVQRAVTLQLLTFSAV